MQRVDRIILLLFIVPLFAIGQAKVVLSCFEGNCENGYGSALLPNELTYSGAFANGVMNGLGKLAEKNGSFYVGSFFNGEFEGYGIERKENVLPKSTTRGFFKSGKLNGLACIRASDGIMTLGQFKDGLKYGFVFEKKNNDIQFGLWENSKIIKQFKIESYKCVDGNCNNGYGIYTYKTPDDIVYAYCGDFVNGNPVGSGVLFSSKGDIKQGIFDEMGLRKGVYFSSDTMVYEGEWNEFGQQNLGIIYYNDGSRYLGNFVDEARDSLGVLHDIDGSYMVLQYKNQIAENFITLISHESISYLLTVNKLQDAGSVDNFVQRTINGCIVGDCSQGRGVFNFSGAHQVYDGFWTEGNRKGLGINVINPNLFYFGNWEKSLYNGKGIRYENGFYQLGEFIDGKIVIPSE